jgi:predicted DNA-binding transcriptional regulator AlpA
MADTVPLADTPLAHWINRAMAAWEDPDTGMLSISQKQLCARTGISTASLYQILKQGHTPKPEVLLTLAAFFMEALLGQAQMLAAAVRRWEGQSGHNRSAVGSIPGWS